MYSKKTGPLILAGFLFLFSAFGYLFNLYPPFQVPLVYLYLFIFLGFVWKHGDFDRIKINLTRKGIVLSVLLLLLGYFVYHYYLLTKDTYSIMLNTVYPGKRVVTGGDLVSGKLFSEFFDLFMSEKHVPQQWMNISETSGFLLFLPVLFYIIGYNYYKFRTADRMQVALSVFLVISMIYILIGLPAFLCKMTLLSMVESRRYLPIAEAGNCILLVCCLSDRRAHSHMRFSWIEFIALAVGIVIFFTLVGNHVNEATGNFFKPEQLKMVTFLFTVIYLLIRYSWLKYTTTLACILILGITLSNAAVNPLTSGLSPILENPLVKTSKAIHEKDPDAVWAVFGSASWAELLKSNGIHVFNGIKITPQLKEMAVIDSGGQNNFIYNRFAHVKMKTFTEWKDTVIFRQPSPDGFTLFMDPCSPRLEKLGIKYFLFTEPPTAADVRCMTVVDSLNFYLFKRKE